MAEGYFPVEFRLCETARWRIEETPSLKVRFKVFQQGFEARPADAEQEFANGPVRYRVGRGWVWSYVFGTENERLLVYLLDVNPVREITFGRRVRAAVMSIVKNYVPHASEASDAVAAYRKPGPTA